MKCSKPCTYSQELAAESSPTLFSDMSQFARSNGTNTVAKFSGSESPKDGSQGCTCTKETLGCSTHPNGKEEWIASMRDFLALRLASLENERERWTKEICGLQPYESLGKFGPDWSFSKTSPDLFPADTGGQSYPTFPASGMTVAGRCWELTRLVPRTEGNDGSLWPTLTASPRGATTQERNEKRLGGVALESALARWESPIIRKDGPGVHGGINPNFLEWFMGFPIGWTEKKVSEIRKSRSKRRPRS